VMARFPECLNCPENYIRGGFFDCTRVRKIENFDSCYMCTSFPLGHSVLERKRENVRANHSQYLALESEELGRKSFFKAVPLSAGEYQANSYCWIKGWKDAREYFRGYEHELGPEVVLMLEAEEGVELDRPTGLGKEPIILEFEF
jgi:hypothetical protein